MWGGVPTTIMYYTVHHSVHPFICMIVTINTFWMSHSTSHPQHHFSQQQVISCCFFSLLLFSMPLQTVTCTFVSLWYYLFICCFSHTTQHAPHSHRCSCNLYLFLLLEPCSRCTYYSSLWTRTRTERGVVVVIEKACNYCNITFIIADATTLRLTRRRRGKWKRKRKREDMTTKKAEWHPQEDHPRYSCRCHRILWETSLLHIMLVLEYLAHVELKHRSPHDDQ